MSPELFSLPEASLLWWQLCCHHTFSDPIRAMNSGRNWATAPYARDIRWMTSSLWNYGGVPVSGGSGYLFLTSTPSGVSCQEGGMTIPLFLLFLSLGIFLPCTVIQEGVLTVNQHLLFVSSQRGVFQRDAQNSEGRYFSVVLSLPRGTGIILRQQPRNNGREFPQAMVKRAYWSN